MIISACSESGRKDQRALDHRDIKGRTKPLFSLRAENLLLLKGALSGGSW